MQDKSKALMEELGLRETQKVGGDLLRHDLTLRTCSRWIFAYLARDMQRRRAEKVITWDALRGSSCPEVNFIYPRKSLSDPRTNMPNSEVP